MSGNHDLGAAIDAHRAGRLKEAETLYRRAAEADPGNAQAPHLLGVLLHGRGDLAGAEAAFRAALAIDPDLAEAHANLGAALLDKGDVEDALAALEAGLAGDSGLAGALVNRVLVLDRLGRRAEAVAAGEAAVARLPDLAPAHNALGVARLAAGAVEEAAADFARAAEIDPGLADAANNLGAALTRLGRLDDAMAAFERALALRPGDAATLANRGAAHQAAGRLDLALADFEAALAADPANADARWNRGIARLLSGDLAGGFADYEARWDLPEFTRRHTDIPAWDGAPADGLRLLVHSEQGYGDTIHMIRYAKVLAERGVEVSVETHAPLARLIATAPGVARVIARGEALPPVDAQAPIMSLPHLLGAVVPAEIPYLRAPEIPAETFGIAGAGRKVGLAWRGRPTHKNDRNRSLPLSLLAPILDAPDASFYGLQVEADAVTDPRVRPLGPHIEDFADTAAALMHLDLVICVDTAVAHLAGALGRAAWVLLPFAPDWRWGLESETTPWYPSLTLYRQPAPGDWARVIDRVAKELRG